MDIMLTRAMVAAAIDGKLAKVKFKQDPIFKVMVPTSCPGVKDSKVLWPKNTWKNKKAYDERAKKLAADFAAQWKKAYAGKGIDKAIEKECPGL